LKDLIDVGLFLGEGEVLLDLIPDGAKKRWFDEWVDNAMVVPMMIILSETRQLSRYKRP